MTPLGGRQMVVDRFEADVVVVETGDGQTWELPRWLLPSPAREGDVIVARETAEPPTAGVILRIDADATRHRRDTAEARIARLRQTDPGGDLEL